MASKASCIRQNFISRAREKLEIQKTYFKVQLRIKLRQKL